MLTKSFALMLGFACVMPLYSAPRVDQNSIVEIQILNSDSKLIWKTKDKEIIDFTLNAIKGASDAGSNTYGQLMDHYLALISPDSKTTHWFLDLSSGHFASETKPKLLIYKFKKTDFEKILEKLKAEPSDPANPSQRNTLE